MIVSHKHRFIFIHITKCAGTSVTRALLPILGEDDLVFGCTPEGEILSEASRKTGGLHKHSTAAEARAILGDDIWQRYYTFAFVRNPWDIQVSLYHWWLKTPWRDDAGTHSAVAKLRDFEEFVLSPRSNRKKCTEYRSADDGSFMVDFIGRYEHLDEDFEALCHTLSLPHRSLSMENATDHDHFTQHYNPLTRDLVSDWYRSDIEAFAYVFDAQAPSFNRPARALIPKPERLIVHCCHHRVATVWFGRLLRRIAAEFGWKFQSCGQAELEHDTDIFMQHSSKVAPSELRAYRGSHMIRDPRDIMVSGYFYHLWCTEVRYTSPRSEFDGKSYQEMLRSVSQERGLAMEIEWSKNRIRRIVDWHYDNPEFLELRFEDFIRDERASVTAACKHYGLRDDHIQTIVDIVEKDFSFEAITGRRKGQEDRESHFRKGQAGDWILYFSDAHKQLFKRIYPGVLTQLEYELDDKW